MASLRLIVLAVCLAACQATAPVVNTHYPTVIEGEYLVQLKTGRVGLSSSTHVTTLNSFHIGDYRALHVKVTDEELTVLREDANVAVIEANTREWSIDCVNQDTGSQIWGLSRTSSRELPNFNGATYNYVEGANGGGVNAYVVDTGIYIGHNDFGGRAVHGFTAPGLVSEGDDDLNGHGTHCAGTTGGTTYGVAKEATLIAVKVLGRTGSGTTSDLIAGTEWVQNQHSSGDRSVINMSLGFSGISPTFDAALEACIAAGVSAAVAAGNSNANACNYSPARVPTAITVAASTNTDAMASFTNFGECCDCIAPGASILSAYIGGPDATAVLSGTSMAAPHVCGWAAVWMGEQASPPSPAQVMAAIENEFSEDFINLGNKVGTPNFLVYSDC
jgi:cerevisin